MIILLLLSFSLCVLGQDILLAEAEYEYISCSKNFICYEYNIGTFHANSTSLPYVLIIKNEGCLSDSGIPSCPPSALNKSGIMTVLQNWRLGKLKDGKTGESMNLELKPETVNVILQQEPPGVPENIIEAPPKPPRVFYNPGQGLTSDVTFRNMHGKKNQRKEPRRHTLANGIDYNMLKRMKQMEQEKDILVQGLEAVDRAKEWYVKQINLVQDKMRYVGRIGNYVEPSSDVYQERLNFQMARIFEVNQHLSALVESTNKGFPLHMNLALRQPTFSKLTAHSANNDGVIQRLKQQNVMLTEEVGKKGERITQLEREKAALIRELFQARSQNRRENDDNTLM
ncbi:Suppressor APC domain-containing protein 2 [Nymphon striatum]|nr:Suppressor APC domain-containing protein 2 [Nymphon striatum]KAG1661110.1 Suppressor APC domain-containing protein 2 [Nymphon striatum]